MDHFSKHNNKHHCSITIINNNSSLHSNSKVRKTSMTCTTLHTYSSTNSTNHHKVVLTIISNSLRSKITCRTIQRSPQTHL